MQLSAEVGHSEAQMQYSYASYTCTQKIMWQQDMQPNTYSSLLPMGICVAMCGDMIRGVINNFDPTCPFTHRIRHRFYQAYGPMSAEISVKVLPSPRQIQVLSV